MTPERSAQLTRLCGLLGYRFQRVELLEEALTHRSFSYQYAEVQRYPDNERMEFLGDAALGLCIATLLLEKMAKSAEGELSTARQNLVRAETLARVAASMKLGDYLRLGQNEHQRGERTKPSILADALEAVFGAVYRDGGLGACMEVVKRIYQGEIAAVLAGGMAMVDPKSKLQEMLQVGGGSVPTYKTERLGGLDHQAVFESHVSWEGMILGTGQGASKKVAEQMAAGKAIARVKPLIPANIGYEANAREILKQVLGKK